MSRVRLVILRLRQRPYTLALGLALLALAVPFATRGVSEWDTVFIPTATHLLAGDDIYEQRHGYVYPPLQAIFAIPVVGLPKLAQRLLWFAVNVAALWYVLRVAWRLAGGRDLETAANPWSEHVACALGLLVGGTFLFNALSHQQSDIVLTALMFAGCSRLANGRGIQAATLFGLAAAMKCTPLLFAPYLLVRGRAVAALWLVAVAGGASLLPDLVHRPATHATWLGKWAEMFLLPMTKSDHRPGVWASDILFNQSFIGALNRWTSTTWEVVGRDAITREIEPTAGPGAIKLGIVVLAGLCGGLTLMAMRRRGPLVWEFSVILAGMLLFSPMSSPAHFGLLLLPVYATARKAVTDRRAWAMLLLAVMIVAALLTNKDLWGAKIYTIALWNGAAMAVAVAALVAGWIGMVRSEPAPVS